MTKLKFEEFKTLKNCQELQNYFEDRAYTHGSYCHYTNLKAINSILKNKYFVISNVGRFNDHIDSAQFGEDKRRYFSLCFSTGVNENLSLWYLYSGMNGKGGKLVFNKNQVKKLIDTATYELCEYDPEKREVGKMICTLEKDYNVKITFRDILYNRVEKGEEFASLKYNTMTNYQIPSVEVSKYIENYKGFQKGLIWYFEKETRLLLGLTGDAKDLLEAGKTYVVCMKFTDEVYSKLKIDLAPEIEDIQKEISGYLDLAELMEFACKTSKVKLNKYAGQLKMDLCKKCGIKQVKESVASGT